METPARNRVAFLIALAIVCGAAAYVLAPRPDRWRIVELRGLKPILLDTRTGRIWELGAYDKRELKEHPDWMDEPIDLDRIMNTKYAPTDSAMKPDGSPASK